MEEIRKYPVICNRDLNKKQNAWKGTAKKFGLDVEEVMKSVHQHSNELWNIVSTISHCESHALSPGGTLELKIQGGWFDSLGSGILVGKGILGFFKNIDLDNS